MSSAPGSETNSTPVTAHVSGVSGDFRQSTLWVGSWPSPSCDKSAGSFQYLCIEPPFASRVSASTAMPCVEIFGSTTVWTNVSSLVPLPLS